MKYRLFFCLALGLAKFRVIKSVRRLIIKLVVGKKSGLVELSRASRFSRSLARLASGKFQLVSSPAVHVKWEADKKTCEEHSGIIRLLPISRLISEERRVVIVGSLTTALFSRLRKQVEVPGMDMRDTWTHLPRTTGARPTIAIHGSDDIIS